MYVYIYIYIYMYVCIHTKHDYNDTLFGARRRQINKYTIK